MLPKIPGHSRTGCFVKQVFVTKALYFTPVLTGYLLSAFGLSTMFAEGVVVRFAVPKFGETTVMQIGLAAFALQCTCLAFANGPAVIFGSMGFSMLGNLVYPSISRYVKPPLRLVSCSWCVFRSEEHTSDLQSLMRISYAVFCL